LWRRRREVACAGGRRSLRCPVISPPLSPPRRSPLRRPRSLGPAFGRLWAAYAVSTFGTWIAFDAFPLIAILVLHSGPTAVSLLAASGLAVAAVAALPLGPWVERRHKRPVMIATDLARCAILLTVPLASAFGLLTFAQLVVVAVVVGAADIAFKAASGAYVKAVVEPGDLVAAGSRLEATTWTAAIVGPPLGGALVGLVGPAVTVVADATSYALSAAGLRTIGEREAPPAPGGRMRAGELLEGWRCILASPTLRPLFFNTTAVNALILAASPLMAVLMLGRLGFAPWQYAVAFGVPCVGGLLGARLAPRLAERHGRVRILRRWGVLLALWPIGLAAVPAGLGGLALVLGLQLALVFCMGVFNPAFGAYRLQQTPDHLVARVLAAWSITSNVTIAAATAVGGLAAGLTGPRPVIAAAGVLMLGTPLLLRRLPAG
jgi:MFS family permease